MIDAIRHSLDFQSTALKLRAERQQVLASNIANADTPGYAARDVDFSRALAKAADARPSEAPRRTHPAHQGLSSSAALEVRPRDGTPGADGNRVDLDTERSQFVDNTIRYEAALRFLNGNIKTLLSAIQG